MSYIHTAPDGKGWRITGYRRPQNEHFLADDDGTISFGTRGMCWPIVEPITPRRWTFEECAPEDANIWFDGDRHTYSNNVSDRQIPCRLIEEPRDED